MTRLEPHFGPHEEVGSNSSICSPSLQRNLESTGTFRANACAPTPPSERHFEASASVRVSTSPTCAPCKSGPEVTPSTLPLLRHLAEREATPRVQWTRIPDALAQAVRHAVDAGFAAWQGDRLRLTLAGAAALGGGVG